MIIDLAGDTDDTPGEPWKLVQVPDRAKEIPQKRLFAIIFCVK